MGSLNIHSDLLVCDFCRSLHNSTKGTGDLSVLSNNHTHIAFRNGQGKKQFIFLFGFTYRNSIGVVNDGTRHIGKHETQIQIFTRDADIFFHHC